MFPADGVVLLKHGVCVFSSRAEQLQISSDGTNYFRLRGAGGHLFFYQTKAREAAAVEGTSAAFFLRSLCK